MVPDPSPAEPESAPAPNAERSSPRRRRLLSLIFVVHWAAVACFILRDTTAQSALPGPARTVLRPAAALADLGWPVARVWLDATAARQHWMLFAPAPSDWVLTFRAIAWYPRTAAGGELVADSLELPGPAADRFPHWSRPPSYDFAFALAYEGEGTFYRATLARRLCRELGERSRRPEQLSLLVEWRPISPPWSEERRQPLRQAIGRFDCRILLAARPPGPNP